MSHDIHSFVEPEQEVTEFEVNSYHRMLSRNHGILQTRIASLLEVKYGREYSIITAVDLELPTGKAVPDVSIFPPMIIDWNADEVKVTTPPITAIEILSPRQAMSDLTDKNNKIYFPAGVKSSWIIIPVLQSVTIVMPHTTPLTFYTGLLKDLITGIELDMADIFR